MEKELIITDAHSDNRPKQKFTVKLHGGSPWFGYIWIDDKCYTVVKGPRTAQIKPTKF